MRRLTPALFTNDLEPARNYKNLLQRHYDDFNPANIQQESDLVALTQLRWSQDRYTTLIETNLNRHIRCVLVETVSGPAERLLLANRRAMAEPDHLQLLRQRDISLRCTIPLANRVDKWRSTK